METQSTSKKLTWHSPKQIGIMTYSGLMFLFSAAFVGGITNTVLPYISAQHGWDSNKFFIITGVANICAMFGMLFFSGLINNTKFWTPKLTTILPLFASALALTIFGWTNSFIVISAMMCINGFFHGGWAQSGNNALVSNWWPTKKGIVLGWATMGINLNSLVWNPHAPRWFAAFGVGTTMTCVSALFVIAAIIGLIFVKNTPEDAGTFPDGDEDFYGGEMSGSEKAKEMREYKSPFTLKKVLMTKGVIALALGIGLAYMANMSYMVSSYPRLLSIGYDFDLIARVYMITAFVSFFGSWISGVCDQKFGTKKTFLCYIVCVLLAFICALNHGRSFVFVILSAILIQAAMGAIMNLIPSFVGTKFGRWDYSAAYSVIGPITHFFNSTGMMLRGVFPNYELMYIFGLCALVVSFFIILKVDDSFVGKAG